MDMENPILKQIQQNLDALQKQIDSMKPADSLPSIELPASDLHIRLKEKSNELTKIMQEIIALETTGTGVCMSAVFSVNNAESDNLNLNESVFYSIDNKAQIESIDENKVAAAVEAFSSPKRINIIKALMMKNFLSSNELTMKTGCIGGQLYHHLSILEAAKIICKNKENEMYALTDKGRNIINEILCIAFGENVI